MNLLGGPLFVPVIRNIQSSAEFAHWGQQAELHGLEEPVGLRITDLFQVSPDDRQLFVEFVE